MRLDENGEDSGLRDVSFVRGIWHQLMNVMSFFVFPCFAFAAGPGSVGGQ